MFKNDKEEVEYFVYMFFLDLGIEGKNKILKYIFYFLLFMILASTLFMYLGHYR